MSGPASPAAAIGWELTRRHRWGLRATALYLALLGIAKLVVIARGVHVVFDSPESFAFVDVTPLTCLFVYALAVLTYGLSGDLAARESMYPSRMFTRPISTRALAGWPMLYGTISIALLWFFARAAVIWPSDLEIPLLWPAMLGASLVAWTQALTWMPYGLRGLRVVVSVFWLAIIDSVVLLALHFKAPESFMFFFLAPHVPLAYATACYAVGRARRGDTPDWSGAVQWLGAFVPGFGVRDHFTSPARAQAWLEWRQHGRRLPVLVAFVLPVELLILFAAAGSFALVVTVLLVTFITPPVLAAFVAATIRKPQGTRDAHGLAPFLATRPMTSPALVAAKLAMTLRSTLITWLIVAVAVSAGLYLSGTAPLVVEHLRSMAGMTGWARAVILIGLVVFAFMLWTWRQLVQTLYIGLTGRDWLIKASIFATLVAISVLGPLLDWVYNTPSVRGAVWDALPVILGAIVLAKTVVSGWVLVRLRDSRLLPDRTLLIGAAAWCVAVLGLYGVLRWWMDETLFANYTFLLVAILLLPIARLSAAPMALAWNRHR